MNNFSPLPASASDSRLSTPEAAAPIVSPTLQARRQKLRRVVTWVVGGATALLCVGAICGAVRAHSRTVALTEASAEAATALATAPAVPTSSATPTAVDSAAVTAAAPASSAAPIAAKPVKKLGAHGKSKHAGSKSALARH